MVNISLKTGEIDIIYIALMSTENTDITEKQLKDLHNAMSKLEKFIDK